MLSSLAFLLVLGLPSVPGRGLLPATPAWASIEEVASRLEQDQLSLAFIGERHGIGPVKRFAVDLANHLIDRGHDVGLYVEGFRVGCVPTDTECNRLARRFNWPAYRALLEHSKATVHPIDPIGGEDRASRMAAAISTGGESIRIVLLGKSHMMYAAKQDAEYRIFGGQVCYPDPGDVAEAFPQDTYLTIGLETTAEVEGPYSLAADGTGADYVLLTEQRSSY